MIIRLIYLETARLLRGRITWLSMIGVLIAFLSGYFTFSSTTMASQYLGQHIWFASLGGTLIFAALTLYESSRVARGQMEALTDCIISPRIRAIVCLVSMECVALLTAIVLLLLYAPFAIKKLGVAFAIGDYLSCFLLYLFPAMGFGSLMATVCYHITGRADISGVLTLVVFLASHMGTLGENFLCQWSTPFFLAMSDDFGNSSLFRQIAYVRLVWLCLLLGGWCFSICCIRCYEKGFWGSLLQGTRKKSTVILGLCFLVGGGILWNFQPLYDHSPIRWQEVEEPDYMNEGLLLRNAKAYVSFSNPSSGKLNGHASFVIENTTGQEQPFYLQLNAGYWLKNFTANGQPISIEDLKDDYIASRHFRCMLPKDKTITLEMEYGGRPRLWNGTQKIVGLGYTISKQYIQLKGAYFYPISVAECAPDAPLVVEMELPETMIPVTSGETPRQMGSPQKGIVLWQAKDWGTDAMTLFAGDYEKVNLQGGGMPIEFYYSRKHAAQMTQLDAVNTMEAAIRFCTERYGARAFTEGRPFKIIQGTEFLSGGFARDNISAVSENSFTVENLTNQEKGANGAEVLGHEIIHQWWGLGVMFSDDENSYWSSEGMTTYTTYRLLKELRGADYANRHYLQEWEQAVSDSKNNFYIRNPAFRNRLPEVFQAQLTSQLQSVNEYSGYALMFARAADALGGEEALDIVLQKLFHQGQTEELPYLTLGDFLEVSGLTKEVLELD